MKYTPEEYANAFLSVFTRAPSHERDALIHRFASVIRKHGDVSRSEQIFHEVRRAIVKKRGGRMVTVEYARPVIEKQQRTLKKNFLEKDVVEIKINPALIAGVRIMIDGEKELDNSARHKLQQL